MSQLIVSWHGVPDELRTAVEPILLRWLHLVPGWCAEIVMQYEDEPGDGSSLRTDVRPSNRDTLFQICPWWLRADENTRETHVVHELVHIGCGPLVNFARETIQDLTEPDSPLRNVLERQCVIAFEGVVQDLALAAMRAPKLPAGGKV